MLTKACTSFFGFVLGDVLAQRLTGADFSVLRCLRLGTYGLTLDGPLGHLWYKILDKTVWPNDPQSNKAVLAKTAADQLIWAPIMTCVFFAVLKTLEGHPELIMQTIQVKTHRGLSLSAHTPRLSLYGCYSSAYHHKGTSARLAVD